jgi:hypothetical protein
VSIERDPAFGCLLWTGRLDRDGYGFYGSSRAHIVMYERHRGPVPDGMELDHLCQRRRCVAWWHLQPVTPSENGRRKAWSYRSKIKECPQGHSLGLHAVVTPERGLVCRQCNRMFGMEAA